MINWLEFSHHEILTLLNDMPILASDWHMVEAWENDAFDEDIIMVRYDAIRGNRIVVIWPSVDMFVWEIQIFWGGNFHVRSGIELSLKEAQDAADIALRKFQVMFSDYRGITKVA